MAVTFRYFLMRMGRGGRDWEKTPGTCSLSPAPRGDLLRKERGKSLAVLPVLKCNGMKPLRGPADINSDDDGTGLVLIHADSRGGLGSRYRFCFVTHLNVMAFQQRLCHCARHK